MAVLGKFTGWKDVSIFNTFAFFVVPLLLIVAAYIAIFFAAKKSLKEHRRRSLKKVTSNFLTVTQRSHVSLVNTSCLHYFQFFSQMLIDIVIVTVSLVLFLNYSILETVYQVRRCCFIASAGKWNMSLFIDLKLINNQGRQDLSCLRKKHSLNSSRFFKLIFMSLSFFVQRNICQSFSFAP